MKSKFVAYLLWLFLGLVGAHKFYVGKIGVGIIYIFTFGLFGVGWFLDFFTLGNHVDIANALRMPRNNITNQQQSVVVNIPSQEDNSTPMST